ncbi:magnesium transporter CorA family protein [Brevundimonas lenta]|uniref:Magnesium transport protein CorA n=1 Tax=Brevundimonas lenta TaxID=424796 RepID=A0A7W6JBP9_9CAUL|nr:magnesium transporter CorA family protein [Brevundimonas lenta]MBB4081241.1 magnesium transporter [Brevundimonas lenta]
MIRVYKTGGASCEPGVVDAARLQLTPDIIWIDLTDPTREEDLAVEAALGLSVPTREEMAELEASSRVYRENGATYMTADIIVRGDEEIPAVDPVTFILTTGPLITIRYANPKPFSMMAEKLEREAGLCVSGVDIFLHLMESIIDRASDILSRNVARVEGIANHVFSGGRTVGFEKLITKLGRAQMANARLEQSLAGLVRIFAFVGIDERVDSGDARAHLRSLSRDAESLIGHNQAVASSINFQLSAALGLINIEQSSIIKIFSVAAVAFLPPTLIASIYGMNFTHMPELGEGWGYPIALVAMVISAILPLAWFKKKGWL